MNKLGLGINLRSYVMNRRCDHIVEWLGLLDDEMTSKEDSAEEGE